MFRKVSDVDVGQANPLSGKDTKSLIAALLQLFPNVTKHDLGDLLGIKPKGKVFKSKLPKKVILYSARTDPEYPDDLEYVFFDANGRGDFYPTIFALWRVPHLMKSIRVHAPVSRFVIKGADVMLPGFVHQRVETEPGSCFGIGRFAKGEKVAVLANGNPFPIAVGDMTLNSDDIYCAGFTGKGIVVQHYYGDSLWEAGGKTVPNEFFLSDQVIADPRASKDGLETDSEEHLSNAEIESDNHSEESFEIGQDDNATSDVDKNKGESEDEAEPYNSDLDFDLDDSTANNEDALAEDIAEFAKNWDETELAEKTFYQAIRKKCKDSDLPILVNVFYSTMMLPCRPWGTTINFKKTRHKKISKLLKFMQDSNIIKIADKNGVQSIIEIKRDECTLRDFKPWKVEDEACSHEVEGNSQTKGEIHDAKVLEYYRPFEKHLELFKIVGIPGSGPKNQYYSASQVRQVLFKYINDKELDDKINPRQIVLDSMLCDLLYKSIKRANPNFVYPTHASKDDVWKSFLKGLHVYHQTTKIDGTVADMKKGAIAPINIQITRGQGGRSKFLTTIIGVERYGINPKEVAKEAQKILACSTSTDSVPGVKRTLAVVVQGNKATEVQKFLFERYKIKNQYVSIDDKCGKAKKNR